MLCISRRPGEIIDIGDDVSIMVLSARGDKVRIGITAPPDVAVDRRELRVLRAAERAEKAKAKAEAQAASVPTTPDTPEPTP